MIEEKDGEKITLVPKPRQKYDEADRKNIEKGYKAKTLLVCGIGPDEFNKVSACESAKEIWDCLKTAHEGTEQVKESMIDMLTSRHENFKIKEGETIHDMFTKLSSITNEQRSRGEPISMSKQVRKVLRIFPKSKESKVDAITEAKDLKVLTMDYLIGNLKTHEMNQNHDSSKKEAKNDKSLMLKYKSDEDSSDDDMAYLINRFQKILRKNKEHHKPRSDKEKRRDLVLGKRDRKAAADFVVKKALATWGDSSSDLEDPDEPNDVSMVAVHEEETILNEMFALMTHTKNEEEDDKVTLLDMINDLYNYSLNKLRTLAKVMVDSLIELTSERDNMNAEIDSLTENKVKLEEKMSKIVSLESDNSKHKNQLNQITEEAEQLNGMSNGLQVEIQEKLKNSEEKFGLSLEKSNKLEKDIVKLMEELEKSLKWTKSSKLF
ncbi:uncharacterized protein [Solanum lycopersicum]|uniref:uncharacterized protein n=1 Tax=Solanum lycopersicum TaxID=4081 RepID=UPI003749585F